MHDYSTEHAPGQIASCVLDVLYVSTGQRVGSCYLENSELPAGKEKHRLVAPYTASVPDIA
eukprot:3531741-Rhodomonas_salina.7